VFLRIFVKLLLLPIKVWIAVINLFRRISGSGSSGNFISGFRTQMENNFSKAITSTYLVKAPKEVRTKLVYMDIGARDGLPRLVSENRACFEKIILCEGEAEEAKKLRAQGYLVIDKFLAEKKGDATFYFIKEHPGASSLSRPGTPFLHLFSESHYDLYTKYTEHPITTSTLDAELPALGVTSIDLIKLDVQGSELSIIKGLTTVAPLFWEVEVLPLPTYQGAPYGTSITMELVNRGYICFRQSDRMCKDGIYIYSNEMYMPDYTKDSGKKMIRENLEKWRLMMELFDNKALASHIESLLN